MSRKARIYYPGAVYHVMLRGNKGQTIFFTDKDRKKFITLLEEGISKYGHTIHAFCLMTNHVHLAIQVQEFSLSKIMHNLAFRYAQWINKKQDLVGHLFQARYKALLVDKDSYLLSLIRYIHLNPVRAGLVKNLNNFKWSSHLDYLGENNYPWVETDWFLLQMGHSRSRAMLVYKKYIHEIYNEEQNSKFHFGKKSLPILGKEEFIIKATCKQKISMHQKTIKLSIEKIIAFVIKYYQVSEDELFIKIKSKFYTEIIAMIAWLMTELGSGTIREVAMYFSRNETSLTRKLRAMRNEIKPKMDDIKRKLIQNV